MPRALDEKRKKEVSTREHGLEHEHGNEPLMAIEKLTIVYRVL